MGKRCYICTCFLSVLNENLKMKKISFTVTLLLVTLMAQAGGLLTNTNQHISFVRMMARGASHEIDAIYTNPAGVAWMDEGWTLSLNIQSAFQTRNVEASFPLFGTEPKLYKGDAAAPVLPSVYAAYRKDRWAVQGFIGVIGGGGKCSFDSGLPVFDSKVMAGIMAQTGGTVTPDMYTINSAVKGRQYIFGGQFGFSYRFNDHFSGHAGFRMNYFNGNQWGYVEALLNANNQPLIDMRLDCDQSGWGITPILGLNYRYKGLTLAAKYEFKTNLNIENDTKELVDPAGALADFKHGVNTPSDIPAMLAVAAGYEFTPRLRATLEYHFFDDKNAEMAHMEGSEVGKQKALKHGTHEFLAGVEFDINKTFTVSAGAQRTDYGLSDDYQSNTSFSCDSYSVGLGGAINLSSHVKINVGYFWTMYSDYTKNVPAGNPGYNGTTMPGQDIYSRTNKVFGMGIDYKF